MRSISYLILGVAISIIFYSCDKNENAPSISDQEFNIEENSPVGALVGTVLAHDNDEAQILSYSIISGNDDGTLYMNPSSGSLSVARAENFDYEQVEQFQLTVAVNDNHEKDPLESAAEVQIDIINVNEIPQDGIQAYYNCSNNVNDISGNGYHFTDPG